MEAGRFGGCQRRDADGHNAEPSRRSAAVHRGGTNANLLSEENAGIDRLPLVGTGLARKPDQMPLGVDTTRPSHGSRDRKGVGARGTFSAAC